MEPFEESLDYSGISESKLDHDMLVNKSLECRRCAEQAETLDERGRWIRMADEFLARAQEIKP